MDFNLTILHSSWQLFKRAFIPKTLLRDFDFAFIHHSSYTILFLCRAHMLSVSTHSIKRSLPGHFATENNRVFFWLVFLNNLLPENGLCNDFYYILAAGRFLEKKKHLSVFFLWLLNHY